MSNIVFDVQKSIYDKLISSSTLMSFVGNRIYDTPESNSAYPFIIIDHEQTMPINSHSYKGFDHYTKIKIFTKPEGLGWYQCENCFSLIDDLINLKQFTLSDNNLKHLICVFNSSDNIKESEYYTKIILYRNIIMCKSIVGRS